MLDDVSNILFTVPKATVDRCFMESKPSDVWGLYSFYYRTAKFQKTNKVWAVDSFVMKGLSWGESKLRTNKKILMKMGLIETVKGNKTNGTFGKSYVKVNYILSESHHSIQNPALVETSTGKQETNALRKEVKMLEEKNKKLQDIISSKDLQDQNNPIDDHIETNFSILWGKSKFPKSGKASAKKAFEKLCKTRWKSEDRIQEATNFIIEDIEQRFEFIGERKSPLKNKQLSSYLNQMGWQDEDTIVWDS